MSAAATATAMASNTATSGKDKKGSKLGGSATIIIIIGVIAVLFVVYIVAKMYTSGRDESTANAYANEVDVARAEAGCLGGKKALINPKTGKFLVDPITKRPICPPPDLPSTQKIELTVGNTPTKSLQTSVEGISPKNIFPPSSRATRSKPVPIIKTTHK